MHTTTEERATLNHYIVRDHAGHGDAVPVIPVLQKLGLGDLIGAVPMWRLCALVVTDADKSKTSDAAMALRRWHRVTSDGLSLTWASAAFLQQTVELLLEADAQNAEVRYRLHHVGLA